MTFNRIDLFHGFLSKTKSIIVGRINNVQHLQNLDWLALETDMTFEKIDLLFHGFLGKRKRITVGRINIVQHLQNLIGFPTATVLQSKIDSTTLVLQMVTT